MSLHLVVVAGNVQPVTRAIPLSEGRVVTIGRSPGSDIQIPELSIARRQCDIEIREGMAWLLDYGFFRGHIFGSNVSVNGRAVGSAENFWPQKPREPSAGTMQEHQEYVDRLNEFMQQQYEKLTWYRLQCGDEIRIGTVVLRLDASVGTEAGGT